MSAGWTCLRFATEPFPNSPDPSFPDAALSVVLRFRVDGFSSDNDVNLWVDNAHFGLGQPDVPTLPTL